MHGTIFSVVLLLVPVLLVYFLRTNAAVLFFVFAAAVLLQTNIDKNVESFASAIIGNKNGTLIPLLLIAVPFIVAAVLFSRTVLNKLLVVHLFLSLLIGLSLIVVLPSYVPSSLASSSMSSILYITLQPYTSLLLASALVISLLVTWQGRTKEHGHKKRH